MDVKNFILLLAAVINTFLGVLVLVKNRKNRSNLWFGFFVLSLVAWCLAMILYRASASNESAYFWVILLYEVAIFIPITFINFASFFPEGKRSLNLLISYILWIPVLFLVALTYSPGLVISGVIIPVSGEKIIKWGPFYSVYNLYFIVYFSLLFIVLFIKFFRSEGILKNQLKFIIFGTFVPSLMANASNLLLPTFGIFYFNWLGQSLTLIMVGFIFYAVMKHQLLNIKVVATEIFAILIPLFLLVDAFLSKTRVEIFWKGVVFVFVSFFSYLLVRSVLKEVRSKERLEKLTHSLHQANLDLHKLDKAKSDFISIASHQLRTPLTAIKGYISMLLEGSFGEIDNVAREKMERTYESAERLIKLVDDLLDLSHMEGGKMKFEFKEVDLATMVASVVEELSAQAKKKNLLLVFNQPQGSFKVWADEEKLRQVVMNLTDNSIKYTKEGKVEVSISRKEGQIEFAVKDTGLGMTKEEILHLFQKFVRGTTAPKLYTEGSGIGLYVAKKVMDELKGQIWAESPGEGRGSTFFVRLPEYQGSAPAVTTVQAPSAAEIK